MLAKIRLEICRDRRDRRLCKIISSCVIFARKQRVALQHLRRNMKFTHIFGKFTHTFSKNCYIYNYIEIYIFMHFISTKKGLRSPILILNAVLSFAKKSQFTRFYCVKLFAQKSSRVKFSTNFKFG